MNLEKNREVMIENQLRPNKITNSNVLQAFMNTSKEQFISDDKINICYSDQDISIKDRRGYLKNLHLAQILNFADIKNNEKVLHIGGLTGYLSVLIAKLCKKIYVTDNDQSFVDIINKNFSNNEVANGEVLKEEFKSKNSVVDLNLLYSKYFGMTCSYDKEYCDAHPDIFDSQGSVIGQKPQGHYF